MITPFRKIYTSNKDLSTIQANIDNTLNSFNKGFLDGDTITIDFSGVSVLNVNHKLGRKINGWVVVDKNAKTDVWVTASDERSITVNVDNDVALKIFIF